MELLCHNRGVSHRKKSLSQLWGEKKTKDRLEKSEGMRHFSPHPVTFLQSTSGRELPCPDDSLDGNSHITYDKGAPGCKMPDAKVTIRAHFLQDNLESAPSHSLLPNPGFCLVTSPVSKAVALGEINRGERGTKPGTRVGSDQAEQARVKPTVGNFQCCTVSGGTIPHVLLQ